MSLEYCEDCDKMIDLDFDSEHECFNKLKTLKDINRHINHEGYNSLVDIRDIKQEAIKCVKVRREIKQPMTESSFMLFFNLTEEDLK